MDTICTGTDSSPDDMYTVKNIELTTVNEVAVLDPIDQRKEHEDGPMCEKENIGPKLYLNNVPTKEIENCATDHTYVRTNLEKYDNDEYRDGVRNEEVNDDSDEVDGLGTFIKRKVTSFITCASGKGMTIDEDNRLFEKANKTNGDGTGNYALIYSCINGQEIEIKSGEKDVCENKEMVNNVIFSLDESVSSCESNLKSQREEIDLLPSKSSQMANTKCTGKEVFLVDPYDFSHRKRGYFLVLVNDTFINEKFREGAMKDLEYLCNVGSKLGLDIWECTNLPFTDTIQILYDLRSLDHSDFDMLAVAISTHGTEQPNPKAKGASDHVLICADDRYIFTSAITEMFNDDNCPSLKNKPKMFIIQACRGDLHDDLEVLKRTGTDKTCGSNKDTNLQPSQDDSDVHYAHDSWAVGHGKQASRLYGDNTEQAGNDSHALPIFPQFTYVPLVQGPIRSSPRPFPVVDTPSLKCENDQLVFYAIPPGMFAWRHTKEGSWMLYYLNKHFEKCDRTRPINVLNILLIVNAEMAQRATDVPTDIKLDNKKAISVVEHKLTRDLIFPPIGK